MQREEFIPLVRTPGRGEGAGEGVRGGWRDLPGCCLHQTGFWDKKESLSAHCYSEKQNPQTQARNSKAARKKAHSCFIQAELAVAWAQRDGRNAPRLGSQLVSSDYPCVNPTKGRAFLQGVGRRGLLCLLSHRSACQGFWAHFALVTWFCSSWGSAPSPAYCAVPRQAPWPSMGTITTKATCF